MNVIFITLSNIYDINHPGIYADLMRKFRDEGNNVYIVSPTERRTGHKTKLLEVDGVKILKVWTLNIQKTNFIEKGVGTLLIERQFKNAIKTYLSVINFDLILYSTPPITFTNVVRYLKSKNQNAISYLLLKDIFPQNAVDIGIFKENSIFHKYFRRKEIALYKISDYIGCMSPANVDYIRKHNPYYPAKRVEVAPNSKELKEKLIIEDSQAITAKERRYIRNKYGLPYDVPIFVYGGNIGKPQGIDYLIRCLEANKNRKDCMFVVVGSGTEYGKLKAWYDAINTHNRSLSVKLIQRLPKEEYDMLVRSCDVGLIFLDHRFTIPNYPSRLLPYLEYKIPIIAATDVNSDIGSIAENNGYGYWCESNKTEEFTKLVDKMLRSDRKLMGENGYYFLKKNYRIENTYDTIIKHFKKEE